jgi:hypothetical protein
MSNQNSTNIVVGSPEAAVVINDALTTLGNVSGYQGTLISEELQLAAQIAELKKTQTVLEALVSEINRKRETLERRQTALSRAHQPQRPSWY